MARFINPVAIALDDNGDPIVGAKLYFYKTVSVIKKSVYSDSAFTTATTNPQVAGAGGRFTGDIFLDGIYNVVLTDANDVVIWTKDPVGDIVEGQMELWISSNTYDIPEIVLGSDDEYYRSITDGNQGNDPVSSPFNWEQLQFGRVWNTNVTYGIGDSAYGANGLLYVSGAASNLGNNPVGDDVNWRLLSDSPGKLENVGFTAAVATKALTFSLKNKASVDPSAANPVNIAFRNVTLTSGDYAIIAAIAATSIVVPDGATLGFAADEEGYVYSYAINNAGTIEYAVAKQAIFDETTVHSTTAIDATSDSGTVLYSTAARANVAVKLIGRIRIITGAVAGEWDNAPTELVVMSPSMKKTGDVIWSGRTDYGLVATGTTIMPIDDVAPPQNTEGDQYMTITTPALSVLSNATIDCQASLGASLSLTEVASAMFQDAIASALVAISTSNADNTRSEPVNLSAEVSLDGTASTFNFRAGMEAAGTTTFNGVGGVQRFAGVCNSYIKATAVMK